MNIHKVTFILLIIGGLNWGLEAFDFGLGSYLPSGLAMVVYILVGLSAVYEIFSHKKLCRNCASQGAM
ncbi:MAG: hypothetical protein A3C70_01215 [Candidatus Zambryskibacteria bacterium RIFCSPHIGHO2_02_FULL_43_14]|uniref:DUF378 domain-containing protein n=1 Tax=Candidatus Zambryskibacteria bacterium RIFCSPHIGHO2_02_FULL_43_14 TaxID=1802748 RepID=A0A1G2TFL6_9BACT|nr:MAG: hypothetical protein A2829_00610 [Candidatus Zambryskibacteria bacterium RIFCSPHIGHO2_01_FULL_43_60]OHA96023.1 MAG: hypothetical protein A3C70_01215 [Candidatus Zambryskibacteria bacterium RIFCSPHIGHO2_02_FULL_43_14]OHB03090.1 MAG: hypothetical protein A3B03_01450 [Candidatus Zambryskibacteria bacterium RIFCSPLOWO2_01_FULL_42_41]